MSAPAYTPDYRPPREVVELLKRIRDDGATVPEGYALGWEIPGSAEADAQLKSQGNTYREDGERRYLEDPVGGIAGFLERHSQREARKEAKRVSQEHLLEGVKAHVKRHGGDEDAIDLETARLLLDEPLEEEPTSRSSKRETLEVIQRGSSHPQPHPKLTRSEVEELVVGAREEERRIHREAREAHAERMRPKREKLEEELEELRSHTPPAEEEGGARHILLELVAQEQVEDIDGVPLIPVKPDPGELHTTTTPLRWSVRRWVEYQAIDTEAELSVLLSAMVEELELRKLDPPGTRTLPPVASDARRSRGGGGP